ncbi:MAG: hypothetical protein GY711_02980 [bacterium]|nr:hypothetical protein [bacterium]
MTHTSGSKRLVTLARAVAVACAIACASPVAAQRRFTFSIDWHGPTIGVMDSSQNLPITEGDIMTPALGDPNYGPLPPPAILATGAQLGLPGYPMCAGHPPGMPCAVELDALSYGTDGLLTPANHVRSRIWFTVDEYAHGLPAMPGSATVRTEFLADDLSSDVWIDRGLLPGPLGPNVTGSHAPLIDGNGGVSTSGFRYPGVGVVEPNSPGTSFPNLGDNVDAFDFGFLPSQVDGAVYFSLDAGFADPLAGASNSGSATSAGQFGAAVLVSSLQTSMISVYAPPGSLGLNQLATLDDIDALVLRENGQPGYQRSLMPYDWMGAGGCDMLLFSVRRGSAVIGQPDSIFGVPIEEGDLLVPPVANGGSPFPGIFVAAEALGLRTQRAFPMAMHGDDLNGADTFLGTWNDCNDNGIEDSVDIATGASSDNNMNGVPDECELAGDAYCTCGEGAGPCGNHDPDAGCANSTGSGAELVGTGSSSVTADDLVLTTSGLPPNQFGLYFMGDAQTLLQFGDGYSCIAAGPLGVHRFPVQNSGASGVMEGGPGIIDAACGLFPPSGCIAAGSTWNFQCWFRDPPGPCGGQWNYSNGWSVEFTL